KMAGASQGDRAARDASGGHSRSRYHRRDWHVRRHPICRAVAWSGGKPRQCARPERDGAWNYRLRAFWQWWSDRDGECIDAEQTARHCSIYPSIEMSSLRPVPRGRLLDRDPPEGTRIGGIRERCGMERRQVVPEHDVADLVGVAQAIFVLQRMCLQLVQQAAPFVRGHAFDLERAARNRVKRLASGKMMRANQLVAH